MKKYKADGTQYDFNSQKTVMASENNSEDNVLIARCQKGNMVAFGQLIEKYQHRLYNAVLKMVNNPDDASDLTQEAFYRALNGLKRFRGSASFYTWLYRIGMNLCINHRSRRDKVKFRSLDSQLEGSNTQADGLLAVVSSDGQRTPLNQAQVNEEYAIVMDALGEIEAPARAVIILRDIEELDYATIAKILEVPVGTIKSRLSRARLLMREKLSKLS